MLRNQAVGAYLAELCGSLSRSGLHILAWGELDAEYPRAHHSGPSIVI